LGNLQVRFVVSLLAGSWLFLILRFKDRTLNGGWDSRDESAPYGTFHNSINQAVFSNQADAENSSASCKPTNKEKHEPIT
jgi:hypothetical protein